jgi:hypothetical protein
MESTIYDGNLVVDPFYLLDIQAIEHIRLPNIITFVESIIDDNKLKQETTEFDYERWRHLTFTNQFVNNSEELNEKILRFIWYLCNKLVYSEASFGSFGSKLYIDDIIQNDKLDGGYGMLFMYIWHSYTNNDFILEFDGSLGSMIKIKFNDNSKI